MPEGVAVTISPEVSGGRVNVGLFLCSVKGFLASPVMYAGTCLQVERGTLWQQILGAGSIPLGVSWPDLVEVCCPIWPCFVMSGYFL